MAMRDERKFNIIDIRLLLSFAVLANAAFNSNVFDKTPFLAISFVVFVIASNLAFLYLPAGYFKSSKLHYIVFIVDLGIILIGNYIFSNLTINFILAIFLTIFISAMSQSVRLSLLIAIVVNAVYIYIEFILGHNAMRNSAALFDMPFIFIVALHSGYLAEKSNQDIREKMDLEKIERFLSKKIITVKEQLGTVADFMGDILRSFRYGVIIIGPDGYIKVFNRRCEELFGVKSSVVEGAALEGMDFLGEAKGVIVGFSFNHEESYEKNVRTGAGKECKVTVSDILSKTGSNLGILCIVREA
jgi:PAS domain-containing protein